MQNPSLSTFATLLNVLSLSWVFVDFFSIFQKERVFFPGCQPYVPLSSSMLMLLVHGHVRGLFMCGFVFFGSTENKGRTLGISRDFLFSSLPSFLS